MVERLHGQKIDIERDPNLIGLFPGSRAREVRKIFPILIEAARELRSSKQICVFELAAASDELANEMEKMLAPQDRHLFEIKNRPNCRNHAARLYRNCCFRERDPGSRLFSDAVRAHL